MRTMQRGDRALAGEAGLCGLHLSLQSREDLGSLLCVLRGGVEENQVEEQNNDLKQVKDRNLQADFPFSSFIEIDCLESPLM